LIYYDEEESESVIYVQAELNKPNSMNDTARSNISKKTNPNRESVEISIERRDSPACQQLPIHVQQSTKQAPSQSSTNTNQFKKASSNKEQPIKQSDPRLISDPKRTVCIRIGEVRFLSEPAFLKRRLENLTGDKVTCVDFTDDKRVAIITLAREASAKNLLSSGQITINTLNFDVFHPDQLDFSVNDVVVSHVQTVPCQEAASFIVQPNPVPKVSVPPRIVDSQNVEPEPCTRKYSNHDSQEAFNKAAQIFNIKSSKSVNSVNKVADHQKAGRSIQTPVNKIESSQHAATTPKNDSVKSAEQSATNENPKPDVIVVLPKDNYRRFSCSNPKDPKPFVPITGSSFKLCLTTRMAKHQQADSSSSCNISENKSTIFKSTHNIFNEIGQDKTDEMPPLASSIVNTLEKTTAETEPTPTIPDRHAHADKKLQFSTNTVSTEENTFTESRSASNISDEQELMNKKPPLHPNTKFRSGLSGMSSLGSIRRSLSFHDLHSLTIYDEDDFGYTKTTVFQDIKNNEDQLFCSPSKATEVKQEIIQTQNTTLDATNNNSSSLSPSQQQTLNIKDQSNVDQEVFSSPEKKPKEPKSLKKTTNKGSPKTSEPAEYLQHDQERQQSQLDDPEKDLIRKQLEEEMHKRKQLEELVKQREEFEFQFKKLKQDLEKKEKEMEELRREVEERQRLEREKLNSDDYFKQFIKKKIKRTSKPHLKYNKQKKLLIEKPKIVKTERSDNTYAVNNEENLIIENKETSEAEEKIKQWELERSELIEQLRVSDEHQQVMPSTSDYSLKNSQSPSSSINQLESEFKGLAHYQIYSEFQDALGLSLLNVFNSNFESNVSPDGKYLSFFIIDMAKKCDEDVIRHVAKIFSGIPPTVCRNIQNDKSWSTWLIILRVRNMEGEFFPLIYSATLRRLDININFMFSNLSI
jgi:hypothetical protein